MNQIVLFDHPLISVWVYPEQKIVHHRMKAYCYGATFRDALTKVADAMLRHKAPRYLADNRAGGAVTLEDQDWATKVWYPRASAAGWSHWAIVQPTNVIGQIAMQRAATTMQTATGLDARVFTDPDEAMKWLESA